VELEGDTLQMVQALRKEGCNLSKYGHIIEEARGVLNGFCQLKVSHIRGIANGNAHSLAMEALIFSEERVCT
jgi:hypothetical protein